MLTAECPLGCHCDTLKATSNLLWLFEKYWRFVHGLACQKKLTCLTFIVTFFKRANIQFRTKFCQNLLAWLSVLLALSLQAVEYIEPCCLSVEQENSFEMIFGMWLLVNIIMVFNERIFYLVEQENSFEMIFGMWLLVNIIMVFNERIF